LQETFTGIDFLELAESDFTSNQDSGLNAKTKRCKLGEVDGFLSHSWHDPGDIKWSQIASWAEAFKAASTRGSESGGVGGGGAGSEARGAAAAGRYPLVWLDKACIDQQNIEQSLMCLPIFLAGCKELIVLAGPTYAYRLWCVMELFTFVKMGGSTSRIVALPLQPTLKTKPTTQPSAGEPRMSRQTLGSGLQDAQELLEPLLVFEARNAQCFKPEDRQHLLAVIESGFGSFHNFNEVVRLLFRTALQSSIDEARGGSRISRDGGGRGGDDCLGLCSCLFGKRSDRSRASTRLECAACAVDPSSAPSQPAPTTVEIESLSV
jgi:hypothetical protein